MTKQMLKKQFKEDIKKISALIWKKYKPEKIILFGSSVRGKMKENSDLDFFIVKNSTKPRHQRQDDVFRLLWGIRREYPVDVVIYTPKELEHRLELGDFFVRNILDEGKVLYER